MPITHKYGHTLGDPVLSPVYVDANFLLYYSVGSHRLPNAQSKARNIMGDLLVQNTEILVSITSVEEAMWGTLQELYCRHLWRQSTRSQQCRTNRSVIEGSLSSLMRYKTDLESVINNLFKLRSAGARIKFMPDSNNAFCVCLQIPDIVFKHNLLTADAFHLSCAIHEAKTLITYDVNDFRNVVDPSSDLTILLLQP